MATVYLGQDHKYHRPIAIKVLKPGFAAALGADRFRREIATAARLQHPNILPVLESGNAAGHLWFSMPYIDGESLRQRLNRVAQLSFDEAMRIATDAARALDYAHDHGVIHRDIKPENLLITKDGTALVADFGIARVVGSDSEPLTDTGLAVGTPAYMSPEQAAGDRRLDSRTDIYSLACVIYEMLSGEPPFTAKTPQGLIAKHLHSPVPDLQVVRSTIPAQMQRVLETALAKAPADRFSSAGEFARAAGDALSGVGNATPHWRERVALIGGVAVTLAIVLLVVRGVVGVRSGTPTPSSTAIQSQASRIAVLYFEDRTPDSSLRLFADGLTEELIHELSGVNAFRVVSRNGVRPYRGRQVPFDSLVAALQVSTVVDGVVVRAGNQVRVRVDLIDARSDTYVDSLSLERPLSDFGMLEQELAQQVAGALRRQMGQEVRLRGTLSADVSENARNLVLRAQRARDDAAVLSRPPHPEDVRTAQEALHRADSLLALAAADEPRWIRPVIDRGWVADERAELAQVKERNDIYETGLELAEEAIRRDPQNAEALELRGTLRFHQVTELEYAKPDPERLHKAEADLRSAVDRDSTLAGAWATLSYLLQIRAASAEAVMAAQRALREDAYLTNAREVLLELFFSEIVLGDLASAGEWCHRGALNYPEDYRFLQCQLTLLRHDLHAKPDPARAWALVKELDRIDPADKAIAAGHPYTPIYRRVVAATISARAGRTDIARGELARAIRATEGDSALRLDLAYDEAFLRLVLGERDHAKRLLRHLVEVRPALDPFLERDPVFQELRPIAASPSSGTPQD